MSKGVQGGLPGVRVTALEETYPGTCVFTGHMSRKPGCLPRAETTDFGKGLRSFTEIRRTTAAGREEPPGEHREKQT